MANALLGDAKKALEAISKEKTELAPARLETSSLPKNVLQSIIFVKSVKLSKEIQTVLLSILFLGELRWLLEMTATETPLVLMESAAKMLGAIEDALDVTREPPVRTISNATQDSSACTLVQTKPTNVLQF
jgi:hypothetical protein